MKKADFTATVISNRPVTERFYKLSVRLDEVGSEMFARCVPGQFAEFRVGGLGLPSAERIDDRLSDSAGRNIILRRPFSFSEVRIGGNAVEIDVLYGVVGGGTLRMTTLAEGDKIDVIGPLGNGFTIHKSTKTALLIGGGTGTPPVQHLSKYLKENRPGIDTTVFVGARSKGDLPLDIQTEDDGEDVIAEFAKLSINYIIATDDGSSGFKGVVTEAVKTFIERKGLDAQDTVIYACGPEPMLKAAVKLAVEYGMECQVSMERMMACGIGLCQSCAIEVKKDGGAETEYKLCCKDGPVFLGNKLQF